MRQKGVAHLGQWPITWSLCADETLPGSNNKKGWTEAFDFMIILTHLLLGKASTGPLGTQPG